ncbi:MAG TPA: HDOD domain-containing protein [Burkholderiaceae bacterium]|jgi:HD-like signal output (HDOD) protein
MPVAPQLRSLDIAIPAQPQALLELSLLLAEDDVNLSRVATLIEADMALASAVLKAVNSSLYGLKGRVQTVQQAITYLGTREVAGVTYEMGLRSVFPHTAELEPVWQRAGLRGLVMGRLGQLLNVDPWVAHSAGLFEECGKAVLYRHAPDHYRSMLRAAADDLELTTLEHAGFGVSHDALGAALCESWGLAAPAVTSVRHHVQIQASGELPPQLQRAAICALSAVAHTLIRAPERADELAARIAPQAELEPALVQRAAARVREQLELAASAR